MLCDFANFWQKDTVENLQHYTYIYIPPHLVFAALHAMQTRSSDENFVCPSVRLSVRPFVCQTRAL